MEGELQTTGGLPLSLPVSGHTTCQKGNTMHGNTPNPFFSSCARKAWPVLLALSALVLLAACGGGTTSSSGATPTAATGTTPTATPAGTTPTATTASNGQ